MLSLRSARPDRPLVIGHRGASGEAPENTLAAFRLAVEQGADIIELDVHLTADGTPVVIHDPTLDRTTNGKGFVRESTLAQVKALDAGSHAGARYAGERVPTLGEVLRWAAGKVAVAIEIKHGGPIHYPGIEALVVEALKHHNMVDSAVVISFDHSAALRAKELCSHLATGVLFAGLPVEPASLALRARADALLPHIGTLAPEMVAEAHAHGLAVCPWVADREQEMRWVLSMGVDAVATNYPARMMGLMRPPGRPAA